MNALPIIIGALCVIAIAYRYYSAFLAAKVLTLDDTRPMPAQTMYDGQPSTYTGKVTMVYVRQGGVWRGVHYHESANK